MSCIVHKWYNVDTNTVDGQKLRNYSECIALFLVPVIMVSGGLYGWTRISDNPFVDGFGGLFSALGTLISIIVSMWMITTPGDFEKAAVSDRICIKCEKVDLGLQRALAQSKLKLAQEAAKGERMLSLREKCLNYRRVSQSLNNGVFK